MRQTARLARQLRDFIIRRPWPSQPPFRLWIDITSRCNLRCPACPQRLLEPGQRRDMDPGLLESLASQVGALGCEVNLFHRGEPLLHPQLGHWIERLRQGGARLIRLHSNATLLDEAKARELAQAAPDLVTLSVDSLEPGAYAAARPGASLARALVGVANLLAARGGAARPRVTLLFMGGPRRLGPAEAALLQGLRRLGLDRVIRRTPHNWGGAVPGGAGAQARPAVCTFPWYGLVVLSDGRVSPCPQDFFGALALGDAHEQGLLDIWQGPRAQALRRAQAAHALGDWPVCQACDRIHRPTILGLPTEHLKNLLVESIVSSPGLRR